MYHCLVCPVGFGTTGIIMVKFIVFQFHIVWAIKVKAVEL